VNAAYRREADALDETILRHITAWHEHGAELSDDRFNALALRVFAHQVRYNEPYGRYCAAFGFTSECLPQHWTRIPAVPTGAFKEAALATFPIQHAALSFQTSGTTRGRRGTHHMESAALYDAALLAGFDRAMLDDAAALRYFHLLPHPAEAPTSSLAYMMRRISDERGSSGDDWYLRSDTLLFDTLLRDMLEAVAHRQPVCLAGTAFALVHLLDELRSRGCELQLPPGSRIMETGGFKGRSRVVSCESLYQQLSASLGIPPKDIVAEYGMTELCSQYYDSAQSRESARRVKRAPPWVRSLVTQSGRRSCAPGEAGALIHVDLANRSSVIAIGTEDLGIAAEEGFVFLGRASGADLRGCSLEAEDLQRA